MTDTDTRAALDAAIDRIADVWTSFMRTREVHPTAPIELADWMAPKTLTDPLHAAITAHVEAEVARRLAVAPSVDDALAAYGTAVYELGYVLHRPDRDAVLRPVKDVAEATLRTAIAGIIAEAREAGRREVIGAISAERDAAVDALSAANRERDAVVAAMACAPSVEEAIRAHDEAAQAEGAALALHRLPTGGDETYAAYTRAVEATEDAWSDLDRAIAADRERAVAEATDGAVQGERFAAEICRLVGARETGTGGQQVTTGPLYANAAKRIERMIARDNARPTPDEARRLVDALSDAAYDAGVAVERRAGDGWRESVEKKRDDARAALLRALGVEA